MVDAALALVDERSWSRLTMAEVADYAGVSLVDAYEAFPTKLALLAGLVTGTDREMLRGGATESLDSPRDRLFDLLMRRFDSLQARRSGLTALIRQLPRDPIAALTIAVALGNSLAWILEAAGVSAQGPMGMLRIKGLGLVYLNALRVWMQDDSPDMARTMAAVDKGLSRAERAAQSFPLSFWRRDSGSSAVGGMDAAESSYGSTDEGSITPGFTVPDAPDA